MGRRWRGFREGKPEPIWLRALIQGEAKIGKTYLAGSFPDVYGIFQSIEGGEKALLGRDVDGYICDSWDEIASAVTAFKDLVLRARKRKEETYKTFLFDGASFAGIMLEQQLRDQGNYRDFRQMWGAFADQWRACVTMLHALPCHVLYTVHTTYEEDEEGHRTDAKLILQGKFGKLLPGMVDGVACMERAKIKGERTRVRRTYLQPHRFWPAGFRFPGLPPYIDNCDFEALQEAFTEAGFPLHE